MRTNLDELDADVAIIGVPFDQGTFGRPGARFGLDGIRDAPRGYNYSDPYGAQTQAEGRYDIDVEDELLRGVTMADCGNITVVPSEVVGNFGKLTTVVEKLWSGVPSRWWWAATTPSPSRWSRG